MFVGDCQGINEWIFPNFVQNNKDIRLHGL